MAFHILPHSFFLPVVTRKAEWIARVLSHFPAVGEQVTIPLATSQRRWEAQTVDFLIDSPNSFPSALSPFFQEYMALAFLPGFLLLIQIPFLFPLQILHRQIERQILLGVWHSEPLLLVLGYLSLCPSANRAECLTPPSVFQDQQHQHYLGACEKCILRPALALWSKDLPFNKMLRDSQAH